MGKENEKGNEGHTSRQANKPLSLPLHTLSRDAVCNKIGTDAAEAESRLEQYGRSELDDGPGVELVKTLARQDANAMTL